MPDSDPSRCPTCGIQLPSKALQGMCPRCLLGVAASGPEKAKKGAARNAPTPAELAALFADWEILELLGQGGMGTVYKVRQPRLDRIVALKVLCCEPEMHDPFSIRFEQEARLLARIEHPNIVALFDFGEIENGPNGLPLFYFLMEYVDGTDLETRIRSGAVAVEESLSIVAQVCDALAFAHKEGVIHRDIKPANLLLDSHGKIKVADFGIAKIVIDEEHTLFSGLTLTGSTMGTPYYMAPETLDHPDLADERSDLYSVGVVLHQLLTGERPAGLMSLPSSKGLPRFLDEPVSAAVERDPEKRVASAETLGSLVETAAARLAKYRKGGKLLPRSLGLAAALVLALLLLQFAKNDDDPMSTEAAPPATVEEEASHTVEATPLPPPPATNDNLAKPGRLVAILASADQPEIDLTQAEPFSDFVQVYQGQYSWVALRKNGDTISRSGHADRSGIALITPGIYDCFSLIDREGKPELFTETGHKKTLQTEMPPEVSEIGARKIFTDEYRALAWLNDDTVRAWGEAYDQPEMIPRWIKSRGQWVRPPDEALRNVTSIGMGFSWDGTVTADGRIWIWGRNGLIHLDEVDAYQGQFLRLNLFPSDNIDAQLKDGSYLRISKPSGNTRLTEAVEPVTPLVHAGKYRLHQTSDGRWHSSEETPLHRKFLDRITGWPAESFSLHLSPWNPDIKNPEDIGSAILIAPNDTEPAIP